MTDKNEALLYAVGDVAPSRPDPHSLFAKTGNELRRADVAFCQYLELLTAEAGLNGRLIASGSELMVEAAP